MDKFFSGTVILFFFFAEFFCTRVFQQKLNTLIMSHSHDHAHGNMTGHNHADEHTPEDELLVTKHTVSVESSSHSHNHSHEVKMLSIYL